jgi:hypothetical protein
MAVLERPRTADRTSARGERARRGAVPTREGGGRAVGVPPTGRGSRWSVLAGVVAVLAGALWSLSAVSAAVTPAGPGEVGLVGGVAHVDAVVSAARAQHAMPGMGADNDPVAEDERRISVDVTLRADEDATLEYAADSFRLTPEGGTAQAPHKLVLPGEELPAGTQLSGTLIFDVPKDAQTAELSYGDQSAPVDLPAEATGPAPAPAAPSDAHDASHG